LPDEAEMIVRDRLRRRLWVPGSTLRVAPE
jgi:hypothetical protein